jgi:hypothetical protein
MDMRRIARDTAATLVNYLTYQAVREVIAQLSETEPPMAYWLQEFSASRSFQQADRYLEDLFRERKELGMRILIVREHLADHISEFMPEMTLADIQKSNIQHRRALLERMTQLIPEDGFGLDRAAS